MKLRVLDAARFEYGDALNAYRKLSPTLAERFKRETDRAISQILEHPLGWSYLWQEYRRYRLHKFPYGIVYRVDPDEIVVVAVMYLRRDPDYWKART